MQGPFFSFTDFSLHLVSSIADFFFFFAFSFHSCFLQLHIFYLIFFLWFLSLKVIILCVYCSFDIAEFSFCVFLELPELYSNSYCEFFTWYITDFHVFVCGYCDSLIMLLDFDFLYKFCIAVVAFEVAVTSLSLYCPWGEK